MEEMGKLTATKEGNVTLGDYPRYESDSFMFRVLNGAETMTFREHAEREDPPADKLDWSLFHPVCRQVWWKRGLRPSVAGALAKVEAEVKREVAGSWKVEVIADNSGVWCSNALRYATEEEAKKAGDNLFMRWTAVREWRAVSCDDPVNTLDGKWIGK